MRSVAELLGMDRTTLTAAARVLFDRELLTIEPDVEDRRSKVLKLTAEGRKKLVEALPIWARMHKAIEAGLGDDGTKRLRRDLRLLGTSGSD